MFSFLKENDVIKIGLIGGGLFALGYQLGKRNSRYNFVHNGFYIMEHVYSSFLLESYYSIYEIRC